MRKLFALAAMILFVMAGCSEDSTKPKVQSSPYNGRFYVTYVTTETNCALDIPPNSASDIKIKDSTITFGTWYGKWIEDEKRGYGKSYIGNDCPNHNPPDHCATCITISFNITFASPDSFSGAVGVGNTYASCAPESCHTHYAVTGRRL